MRLFCLLVCAGLSACGGSRGAKPSEVKLDEIEVTLAEDKENSITDERNACLRILKTSSDRAKLKNALLFLWNSKLGTDESILVSFLQDEEFLGRLDSESAYDFKSGDLGIREVLLSLGRPPNKRLECVILELGASKAFLNNYHRRSVLFEASENVREPSKRLLDLLDALVKANQELLFEHIEALCKMGSKEACSRIQSQFYSAGLIRKNNWFKVHLLTVRNDEAIVDVYKQLLENGIDDNDLRNDIIQSLFSYHPWEWYHNFYNGKNPKPPSRLNASSKVLQELKVIAEHSVKLEITAKTRKGVLAAHEEIEAILEFRRSGGPERVPKLIADLGNEKYVVREQASRDLEGYGVLAEANLRAALRESVPPEVRRRIEGVLAKLKTGRE